MKIKELIKKTIKDFNFRTLVSSSWSTFISFLFAIYNIYLGIRYTSSWHLSIFGYYILLLFIRGLILLSEKKASRKDSNERRKIRRIIYNITSVFLFALNLALIVPISLMVMYKKDVNYGMIPSIAMAAYTTYKVTVAIINYKKHRKDDQLAVSQLKIINFEDAMVSILSLQNTLIMVNGGADNKSMLYLTCSTSLAIILIIMAVSVNSYIRSVKEMKNSRRYKMNYRKYIRANLDVSEIGIGCGSLHESTEEEITDTIDYAIDHGINYFDLICSYDKVLPAFAKAIKGRRDKVILQVHFGATYPSGEYNWCRNLDEIKKEYERIMDILDIRYIDNGFIQCVDDVDDFNDLTKPGGLLDYMKELKNKGKIRHLGFSSHNPKIANMFLDLGCMDIFMFSINPGYDYQKGEYAMGEANERAELYKRALRENIGITVMKPFGGGQLLKDSTSPFKKALTRNQCIKYCLDKPAVLTALCGIRNKADLMDILNYETASEEEKDYSIIQSFTPTSINGTCVYCNHCHPCPKGINIGLINKYYDLAINGDKLAIDHYDKLNKHASDCIKCGHCNSRCPFHVDQMKRMETIKEYFKK